MSADLTLIIIIKNVPLCCIGCIADYVRGCCAAQIYTFSVIVRVVLPLTKQSQTLKENIEDDHLLQACHILLCCVTHIFDSILTVINKQCKNFLQNS